MIAYIIYFAIFVAAFLAFEAMAQAFDARRQRGRSINRRLQRLKEVSAQSAALTSLIDERKIDFVGGRHAVVAWLRQLWTQSGVTMEPRTLAFYAVIAALGVAIFGYYYFETVIALILGFAFSVVLLPLIYLMRKRKKRIDTFTRQLPQALDIVIRSLRAGHPVATAVALVGRESPDPIGTEFGIVSDEMTYGLSIDDAMLQLAERVGAEDLDLLATSISVQRTTGGNLAEILANLSKVIRDRIYMRARIRAISAEGRMTAWLMAFWPFVMYFLITLVVPNYFDTFWESSLVVPILVLCAFLMTVGNYVLYKLVNFDF